MCLRPRWYFGGVAACCATVTMQPLEVIKTNIQTKNVHIYTMSTYRFIGHIIRKKGIAGLYTGISAQIARQLTYSTTRFGLYEVGKERFRPQSIAGRFALASITGAIGGFIGTPFELVNMRMQNDLKLPSSQRKNYKNIFDGLYRIYREEGFRKLFTGVASSSTKADIMTVGQIALYEQLKGRLLSRDFEDNMHTHLMASLIVVLFSTTLSQPLDVIKTRIMTGNYMKLGVCDLVTCSGWFGPLAFFRGFIPALLRSGPQTVMTTLILEQLRLRYGVESERWEDYDKTPRIF